MYLYIKRYVKKTERVHLCIKEKKQLYKLM